MEHTGCEALWKLLWDYDPNGLLVVDEEMQVVLVNPALCEMFRTDPETVVGSSAEDLLGDVSDFETAWAENTAIHGKEVEYPVYDLYVRKVIFPIQDEGIIACIMVDLSREWNERRERGRLRHEMLEHVNGVVDRQMRVAQEIASLLGETTAQTKVSLIKVRQLLEEEPS